MDLLADPLSQYGVVGAVAGGALVALIAITKRYIAYLEAAEVRGQVALDAHTEVLRDIRDTLIAERHAGELREQRATSAAEAHERAATSRHADLVGRLATRHASTEGDPR